MTKIKFLSGNWSEVPESLKKEAIVPQFTTHTGEQMLKAGAALLQTTSDVTVFTNNVDYFMGLRVAVGESSDADVQARRIEFLHFYEGKVTSILMNKNGRLNDWPNGFFDTQDYALSALVCRIDKTPTETTAPTKVS